MTYVLICYLESICKPVHFFKILHNTVYIDINNFIFKHLSANFFYIDRRRKLYSIKSERFEGILEALMKNLHLFIPQFFGLDETSALPIV